MPSLPRAPSQQPCLAAASFTTRPPWPQNNVGTVWRNETGPLINQQFAINLTTALPAACTAGATGTNCWHRLVVQGKAFDAVTKGVQTGSMVTAFEAVPPCPPTQTPFMTSVWQVREEGAGCPGRLAGPGGGWSSACQCLPVPACAAPQRSAPSKRPAPRPSSGLCRARRATAAR